MTNVWQDPRHGSVTLHNLCNYTGFYQVNRFPYFLVCRFNTEKYSVSLRIQSKCGKIQTRKTPNKDTFHVVIYGLDMAIY